MSTYAVDPRPAHDPQTEAVVPGPIVPDGTALRQTWLVVPLPPPPPAPVAVTRRQLLLWLNTEGITRAMIRAQLETIPPGAQREAAMIDFEEALDFRRDHPLVQYLAAQMGYSPAQLEAAFAAAAQL